MNYFNVINNSIEFIETEIKTSISLEQLAERAHISKYHFMRVFKALSGKTPKEYIDERKLTEAAKLIKNGWNIVDAAFEYGFESHEAFSRRFRNVFGASPADIKRGSKSIKGLEPIQVVEREFTNNSNKLFPSFVINQKEEQIIIGKKIYFQPNDTNQLKSITKFVSDFVEEYAQIVPFDSLYGVVNNEMGVDGELSYFSGVKNFDSLKPLMLEKLILPASEYAVFTYSGDMGSIFEVVFADVCQALLITGKEFNKTTIELYELYQSDYSQTGKFSVYIPVK